MFLLARFCSDCNLQISRIALLLYVIVWGRWPFARAEDWTEVLRVVDHLLCWVGQNVLILIFTGIIPVWWPLGNLNLLFRGFFFPEASPERPSRISCVPMCCCWQRDRKRIGSQGDLSWAGVMRLKPITMFSDPRLLSGLSPSFYIYLFASFFIFLIFPPASPLPVGAHVELN